MLHHLIRVTEFSSCTIQVTSLLNRMQLRAEQSVTGDKKCIVNVHVPPTRSDVLHACDVVEVAILRSTVSGFILSALS